MKLAPDELGILKLCWRGQTSDSTRTDEKVEESVCVCGGGIGCLGADACVFACQRERKHGHVCVSR